MQLAINQVIPSFVRNLLRLGPLPEILMSRCAEGIEKHWFQEHYPIQLAPAIIEEGIDCLLLALRDASIDELKALWYQCQAVLNPFGRYAILIYGTHTIPWQEEKLDRMLIEMNLMRYNAGEFIGCGDYDPVWAMTMVRSNYNPVLHARFLNDAGRPECAVDIIEGIPDEFVPSPIELSRLALEKQKYFLNWQRLRPDEDSSSMLFCKERREFAQVTVIDACQTTSYNIHARFWSRLGRTDMAARVLRSISHVKPEAHNLHLVTTYESGIRQSDKANPSFASYPQWKASEPMPRILLITMSRYDYGLDTLYHGLCNILGKDNVIEFPWKPTLHGRKAELADNYPCTFQFPGEALTVDELTRQLEQGRFDLVIYADVMEREHRAQVRRLLEAASGIPVVLYDTSDYFYTPKGKVLEYTGLEKFDLIFRREYLEGLVYDPDTFALPYGYPDCFADPLDFDQKSEAVFWAGKCEYGLRPLYVKRLEDILGIDFNCKYDQATYRHKLRASRIGLSFFGYGFDTVRYWELPAHGVMLLAERPPIRIPNNFIDGVSAVFFDDLTQMEEKLAWYTARPDEAARIAMAGRAHYLRYHTTTGRARQFMGIVAEKLPGRIRTGLDQT